MSRAGVCQEVVTMALWKVVITQGLRGRASDSRLREPGCCGVKNRGQVFHSHCSSSLNCINEYLAIDSGGYVYEQPFAH